MHKAVTSRLFAVLVREVLSAQKKIDFDRVWSVTHNMVRIKRKQGSQASQERSSDGAVDGATLKGSNQRTKQHQRAAPIGNALEGAVASALGERMLTLIHDMERRQIEREREREKERESRDAGMMAAMQDLKDTLVSMQRAVVGGSGGVARQKSEEDGCRCHELNQSGEQESPTDMPDPHGSHSDARSVSTALTGDRARAGESGCGMEKGSDLTPRNTRSREMTPKEHFEAVLIRAEARLVRVSAC